MNNPKRRRGCLTLALILLVPICLVTGYFGVKGYRLYTIAQSLQTTQAEAESLLANGVTNADPEATAQLVRDVRADFVDLKHEVEPLLWMTPFLGWLPEVGDLMPEAEEYLALADAGTRAADTLAPVIEDGLAGARSGDLIGGGLAALSGKSALFEQIEPDVENVQAIWQQLETKEALPWAVRQRIPQIDALLPLSDEGVEAAQIAPTLLGADGEKTYLMLVQNDDELRASGGFMSSAGILRVADGNVVSLDFHSTDLNYEQFDANSERFGEPPQPLWQFMNLQYFLYRDAGYWPDFVVSAEKILELYPLEYPNAPEFDGVIAIDQQFVSILLQGTGSVYVPELDQSVNSANVIDTMRNAWNPPDVVSSEWMGERKSFVADVARAIQERVLTDPTQLDPLAMGTAIMEAIETRHLQIYSTDSQVAAKLRELGWDGHVAPIITGDQLMFVDMNAGYNKADGAVRRSLTYDVDLGDFSADLALRYHHTDAPPRSEPCEPRIRYTGELRYADMLYACLYNFVRVYPAPGSALVDSSAHPISGELTINGEPFDGRAFVTDEAQTHFANFFIVEPATILLNTYQYELPESVVEDGVYRLNLRKQAGARMVDAQVNVTVPDGATITATEPSAQVNGDTATFTLDFDRDIEIAVTFTP